jgi:hypothetical protein
MLKSDVQEEGDYSMFQEIQDSNEEYLVGWKEIRNALRRVEVLRESGQNAKVEIINSMGNTTLRVTLRSENELEEYFNSHLRQLILNGLAEDNTCVSGRIVLS